jgi:hypothetical protein
MLLCLTIVIKIAHNSDDYAPNHDKESSKKVRKGIKDIVPFKSTRLYLG